MIDEPNYGDPVYDKWLASRRTAEPSIDLTGRVMAAIRKRGAPTGYVGLADRMNQSPLRWGACAAALLVGSLPFFFVAYVAQSRVF